MAEKAKEQPKDINLEMDNLTPKGKIHAEQYNNLKIKKSNIKLKWKDRCPIGILHKNYSNWSIAWRPKT